MGPLCQVQYHYLPKAPVFFLPQFIQYVPYSQCRVRRTKNKQECGHSDARRGKVAGTDQGRGHASEYLPPSSPTLHSSSFNSTSPRQVTVHLGYCHGGLGFDSGDFSGVCQVNIPPVGLILSIFKPFATLLKSKLKPIPQNELFPKTQLRRHKICTQILLYYIFGPIILHIKNAQTINFKTEKNNS